jgi:hypothetical protein
MKYILAVVLYFLFTITAMLAGLQGLVMLLFKPRMTANIMHSMDMLLAAQLGWNGRSTVSKECGLELLNGNPCTFCTTLCKILTKIDTLHCEREASK